MEKPDIKSMRPAELEALLAELGQPRFRAKQVFRWLHARGAGAFREMSDLPAALRQQLEKKAYINSIKIEKRLVSGVDGTVKYLYELGDGNAVEAVLMQYNHADSLCISTQAGCRMGCAFCASTRRGLARNLTASEMLDEVYTARRDSGRKIGSLVLMGIGEPLDNYDNVLRFLELLSHPDGLNLSLRHVSLSTCGLVDKINALAKHRLGLTLSVSLHAPTNSRRDRIMPVNRKWPVETLVAACRDYFETTGRRVSFEYALIDGQNDSGGDARALASLLGGFPCHVNLIPVNEVAESGFKKPSRQRVHSFREILEHAGLNVTVRRELGADIAAACGQLRLERPGQGISDGF